MAKADDAERENQDISIKTEYGDTVNKTDPLYFKWEKDNNDNNIFVSAADTEKNITYYIKNSGTVLTNVNDAGVLTNPSGANNWENPAIIIGGASVNNVFGSTITISDTLFKDNVTTGKLVVTKTEHYYAELQGGAVYNAGAITDLNADFVNNSLSGSCEGTVAPGWRDLFITGGALYNAKNAMIGDINGDFVHNNVFSFSASKTYGGAIANAGAIANIYGDFINNYASSSADFESVADGGAIYNYRDGTIEDINGNFIGNYVKAVSESESYGTNVGAYGGAISNGGVIKDINGDFVGNYAYSSRYSNGGAIDNGGIIGLINGNFIGNHVFESEEGNKSNSSYNNGGAIYNSGLIKGLTGDFIGNYAYADASARGGAINNEHGLIEFIEGNFKGNYASAESYAYGGAIYNYTAQIKSINGDFVNNYAVSNAREAMGGAIYNLIYSSDFENWDESQIGKIEGDFIGNQAATTGSGSAALGGAIYNELNTRGMESRSLLSVASSSPADDTLNQIGEISGRFINNHAKAAGENSFAAGGAIFNIGTIGSLVNTSFINNYAQADGEDASAKGGAILSTDSLDIFAVYNGLSIISGNYTMVNGIKDDNGIYLVSGEERYSYEDVNGDGYREDSYKTSRADITLNANTGGTIVIDDKIMGSQGGKIYYEKYNDEIDDWENIIISENENYKIHITGDDTGLVQINNKVEAEIGEADIDLDNTTLQLAKDDTVFNGNNLTLNSGTLSMLNNQAGTMALKDFTLKGNTNFAADVNLANKTMDRITADTYTVNTAATLNVNYLNLLNDASQDKTYVPFAEADLANNVAYTGLSPIAYSPIYKYQVDYLKETGEFLFTRGGGYSSNPSDNYNPSVLPTPVNSQAGGYTTQLQTFNYAFQHSDTFMQIPAAQRFAIKNQNKYALSPTGDATDVGVFSPLLTKYETGGIWFKPYASFENIPLKNGPKVNNINYGTLVGFDSDLKSIKHGWERVLTGYIGYNGATQNFSGVTSNQNGGILGTTATFYKGNFFNATTLSVGATAGSNNTMYGSEDYTMLLAGIADKFGYNFEFKEGKYIIQPSMLLSYSFVNTFDYRNAAGVNIQSDPLNALQLAPGIKFIMNTKNGWQPYIGINMVWNIMDQTKVKANDVRLPSMSIDPYIEYGVGVQRKWGERFMGYAQAMVHSGGRNGISLNGGFRWAIGKR